MHTLPKQDEQIFSVLLTSGSTENEDPKRQSHPRMFDNFTAKSLQKKNSLRILIYPNFFSFKKFHH